MSEEDIIITMAQGFRLQWEPAQDMYVLLYPEGMVKLSPSASEILGQVNGARTVSKIITQLQEKYPEADLAEDVREFVGIARSNGWIN